MASLTEDSVIDSLKGAFREYGLQPGVEVGATVNLVTTLAAPGTPKDEFHSDGLEISLGVRRAPYTKERREEMHKAFGEFVADFQKHCHLDPSKCPLGKGSDGNPEFKCDNVANAITLPGADISVYTIQAGLDRMIEAKRQSRRGYHPRQSNFGARPF